MPCIFCKVFFFVFCFLGYVRTINSLYKYISFFIEENSYGLLSMKRLQVRKHIHIYLHTTVTTNSGSSVGIGTLNLSALVQITDVSGRLKNTNQNFFIQWGVRLWHLMCEVNLCSFIVKPCKHSIPPSTPTHCLHLSLGCTNKCS